MKKLLLTSAVLIAFHLGCCADDFTVGGIKYQTLTDGTVKIKGYDKNASSIQFLESVSYNGIYYKVTSIGKDAFSGCVQLQSVTIPNGVTSIEESAFYGCRSLKTITIPNSVTSIGKHAFYRGLTSIKVEQSNPVYDSRDNCNAIIETKSNTLIFGAINTVIPNSVKSIGEYAFQECEFTTIIIPNSVTTIGDYAFAYCSLSSINIPNGVASIGEGAFIGCSRLTSITIPNSVTYIGRSAFVNCIRLSSITVNERNPIYDSRYNCNALIETTSNTLILGTKNTVIPKDVTSIGEYAFYYYSDLTSVTIPNSVTSIGEHAFSGCKNITSITIPNSVTSIGSGAFSGCTGLTSVTIPNSVTSIGEDAFYGCTGLTSIIIPNRVTSIGSGAFSDCTGLTSIIIPSSVESIGDQAFYDCSGLKTITCYAAFPPEIYSYTFNKNTSKNINVYVPCESIDDYRSKWNTYFDFKYIKVDECALKFTVGGLKYRTLTDNTVEVIGYENASQIKVLELVRYNGVTYTVASIKDGALKDCKNLISAVIPNTMTKIGDYTFSGCTSLSSIIISNSVASIGECVFSGCTSLKSVTIPSSVISIGKRAFQGSGLTSISIPNSVTSIGEYAFYGCKNITSITIPNSVTSIRSGAFSNCTRLTSVTIPNSVVSIGTQAFSYCSDLPSITIPNDVAFIGDSAFFNCRKLISITIPNSVTSIKKCMFSGCSGLTSVTIPNSIITIENNAFSDCSRLTSVTIPNSVTSIGRKAFSGSGLTSITIPNSVESIGDGVFYFCSSLNSIKVEKENPIYDSRDNCNAIIETKSNNLIFGFKNTIIPNSVASIGSGAFYHCSGLTSITIPNSVSTVGEEAFYSSGLTSITLLNNVTSIEKMAFSRCENVKSITCYAAFPPDVKYDAFYLISKNINVLVPCESIDYYRIYWDYFDSSAFRCIEATKVQTNTNSKVTPNATSAVIVWSVERDADRFKITVTNNGNLVFTIYINSKGQITSIDYAEGGTRGAELRAATATYNGFKYEMIGLNPDTEYEYAVTTYDINDGVLRTDTGNFKTLKEIVGVDEESENTTTLKEKLSITGKELTVSGTEPSDIKIYNTAGQQVGNPVPAAGVYVVKVGDETVKVLVK